MSFRRIDAALVLSFLLAAFGVGALGLSELWVLMLAVAGVGVWAWRQERQLAKVNILLRAIRGFVAYAVIGFALVAAFELGRLFGGHT